MDDYLKEIVEEKKNNIKECIYNNINFLIKYNQWSKNNDFFQDASGHTEIPIRTIKSWYYKEKLPRLNSKEITSLTRYLRVNFSDFVSINISKENILPYSPAIYIPSDIAKQNIKELLIHHNISNASKFESFIGSSYSSNYFYVLQRQGENQRNLSWKAIIKFAYCFNLSISKLFKIEVDYIE